MTFEHSTLDSVLWTGVGSQTRARKSRTKDLRPVYGKPTIMRQLSKRSFWLRKNSRERTCGHAARYGVGTTGD